ncbi:helix-turn-helix transcriptional regulator [Sphingopyxis fribergensis]
MKTVLERNRLSRATLHRKIAQRTFPPQLRIRIQGSGWHEATANRWIADPAGYRATRASLNSSQRPLGGANSVEAFAVFSRI